MGNVLVKTLKESIKTNKHLRLYNALEMWLYADTTSPSQSMYYFESTSLFSLDILEGKLYTDNAYTIEAPSHINSYTAPGGNQGISFYRNPNDQVVPKIRINGRLYLNQNCSGPKWPAVYLGDLMSDISIYRISFGTTFDSGKLEDLFKSWIIGYENTPTREVTARYPPQIIIPRTIDYFKWNFNNTLLAGTYGIQYDRATKIGTVYHRVGANIDNITSEDTVVGTYNLNTDTWSYPE